MKLLDRQVFIELAREIESDICCWCKFSKTVCGGSPCDHGEPFCVHPLKARMESGYDIIADCWGFRPELSAQFCADIAGVSLANNRASVTWWKDKSGRLLVAK